MEGRSSNHSVHAFAHPPLDCHLRPFGKSIGVREVGVATSKALKGEGDKWTKGGIRVYRAVVLIAPIFSIPFLSFWRQTGDRDHLVAIESVSTWQGKRRVANQGGGKGLIIQTNCFNRQTQ